MSNMSYCRFRNTLADLKDCRNTLEALLTCSVEDAEGDIPLSRVELEAAKELISSCIDVVNLVGECISGSDGDLSRIEENFEELIDTANADAAISAGQAKEQDR